MPSYRAYRIDRRDRVLAPATVIEAEHFEKAVEIVRDEFRDQLVEIWLDRKLVARVDPRARGSGPSSKAEFAGP